MAHQEEGKRAGCKEGPNVKMRRVHKGCSLRLVIQPPCKGWEEATLEKVKWSEGKIHCGGCVPTLQALSGGLPRLVARPQKRLEKGMAPWHR